MRNGDLVDVSVIDRPVGPGRIVDASVDPVLVIVRRPVGDDYGFGASRSFFQTAGPGRWWISMPAPTLREFLPEELAQ